MNRKTEDINGKKIGIITYHGSDNYGSVLQSFAILNAVNAISEKKAEIINYISEEQDKLYAIFFKPNTIKNIIKNSYIGIFLLRKRMKQKKAFTDFRKDYLKVIQKEKLSSLNTFSDEEYDTVICGSDQIWNLRTKDFHPNYMLSFVSNARKVSYAASMGGLDLKLNSDDKAKVKELLSSFQAISVRENIAKKMLSECGINEMSVNIDPVFLLDQSVWQQMASPRWIQGDYIFFYSVDYNEESVKIAKWYAENEIAIIRDVYFMEILFYM